MTNAAQKALERLFDSARYDKSMERDLLTIKKEVDISDDLAKAAMKESVCHEITEAKIAALKEANKQLTGELIQVKSKYDILVEAIGKEKAKTLLTAFSFDMAAEEMKMLADQYRKDAGEEGAQP